MMPVRMARRIRRYKVRQLRIVVMYLVVVDPGAVSALGNLRHVEN